MNIVFIILNLLMVFSSHLASYRYFKKAHFSEQLIAAFLIYASQVTFSILFLGVVVKNLGLPWILALNGGISLFILLVLRKTIKESIERSYEKILNFSKEIFRAKDFFLYLFAFLFATQIVLLLIKIYYLPPHVWDVFSYHLHPVVEWVQRNMIPSFIDSPVVRLNRNPMGPKLFHFWCVQFSGDIRWIELPQFIFGLLVPLTSYAVMLKLNLRKITASRYAILIYFIPLILIESRTCQDHLVLTGALLMAVLYFIDVFYEGKFSRVIFLSLALGLVLGTKISGPQIIFMLFPALLLSKGFNRFKILDFLKKNRGKILSGLVIMFLLGGYWYFKNNLILKVYSHKARSIFSLEVLAIGLSLFFLVFVLQKGLKKHRAAVTGFMKKNRKVIIIFIIVISILASIGILQHMDLLKTLLAGYKSPTPLLGQASFYSAYPALRALKGPFLKNLLVFPFRVKDIGLYTSYTPDFLEKSGFGIQFFAFGLIAYIAGILFIAKKKYRNGVMGFILIFSTALLLSYFLYYFTPANYRMFMFFPIIGLILWAFISAKFAFRSYYLKIIDILILVMILFNTATCFFEGNMHRNKWKSTLTISNPLDRTAVKYSFFLKGADWRFIDSYIPPGESIGYMGHCDSWVFPYFDNRLERKIHHLPSLPGFRLAAVDRKKARLKFNRTFVNSLKQRAISFIHLNPQGARDPKKREKRIIIDDKRVHRVSKNLYYFKW